MDTRRSKLSTHFEPTDIFLTRGSSVLSKVIRFFTRTIGERRTKVNHVGIIVEVGSVRHCMVIEALSKVKKHSLWSQYGPLKKDLVAVFRPINLTQNEKGIILHTANKQVGRKYGYFKIITHLLDWMLLGAYVFRRLTNDGRYPICSWLVAHSFAKAKKYFDVKPGAADPDDIWDFVVGNPDKYQEVYPLSKIWEIPSPKK